MPNRDSSNHNTGFLSLLEQQYLPTTTRQDRIKELKGRFSQIWWEKFGGDGVRLSRECGIAQDTFYRLTKRMEGRNIKRHHVLRLSIGARLTEAEARELLDMLGEPLDEEHSRLDYIFLCNLRHGSPIEELEHDLRKYELELK